MREEFNQQGARDWESFLSLRASELVPGGRLVVALTGIAEHGASGFEDVMDHANGVLAEMVKDGALTSEERARMVIGSHPRRMSDLLAPFAKTKQFESLSVEAFDESVVTDTRGRILKRTETEEFLRRSTRYFSVLFSRRLWRLRSLVCGRPIPKLQMYLAIVWRTD